jgi:glucose/arabinose dehydrogenase
MRLTRTLWAALAGSLMLAATASAQGPPPPTAANGAAVQTVAQGVPTPTQFAFAGGTLFAAAGGSEEPGGPPGGVFVLKNGTATRVPNSPAAVFGVAWRKGKLYLSAGPKLLVWSKWNGTTFKKRKTLRQLPTKSAWWNGLAFGPDGRIYAGIGFNDKDEFTRPKNLPYNKSWVSIKTNGKGLRVVARGLRQPWMTTFVNGRPFLSVLAQDNFDPPPPDWIVNPRQGQDYGYPKCNRSKPKPCRGYAKPFTTFPNHASPMGLGAIGKKLYVALFGGLGTGPTVVSVPLKGGDPTPFLTGYVAPVVALGVNKGWVYTGDLTGAVYKVKP